MIVVRQICSNDDSTSEQSQEHWAAKLNEWPFKTNLPFLQRYSSCFWQRALSFVAIGWCFFDVNQTADDGLANGGAARRGDGFTYLGRFYTRRQTGDDQESGWLVAGAQMVRQS